jgi:hypothetical protein
MSQSYQTIDHISTSVVERNRVLRNTYWLLALSMVPTVLGAWVGIATGITASLGGIVGLLVFLGGAFGFMFAIEKTKNSAAGVPMLLGFTFFMGLMLSRLLAMVLGFKNGSELIMTAFAGTAGVFVLMASLSQDEGAVLSAQVLAERLATAKASAHASPALSAYPARSYRTLGDRRPASAEHTSARKAGERLDDDILRRFGKLQCHGYRRRRRRR